MSDVAEKVQESLDQAEQSNLNGRIALFVALAATFMALCNVKDGNVVQAMQQAQAKSIDLWAYYQAKGTKQNLAESTAVMLRNQLDSLGDLSPEKRARIEKSAADQEAASKRYGDEKAKIKAEAEGAEQEYNALNVHDDQFDLAEACLSVSIALAGITALTQKRWLLVMAGVLGSIGLLYGLAGFFRWSLHSDLMSKLLG